MHYGNSCTIPVPERHNFWRVGLVEGVEVPRQAKVADLQLAPVSQQQVRQLQVPRHDPVRVQEVHSFQQLRMAPAALSDCSTP